MRWDTASTTSHAFFSALFDEIIRSLARGKSSEVGRCDGPAPEDIAEKSDFAARQGEQGRRRRKSVQLVTIIRLQLPSKQVETYEARANNSIGYQ